MTTPPLFPWFRVAAVLGAGTVLLLALRTPPADSQLLSDVPPVWATDVSAVGMGPLPLGEPARPFKGQKEAPCTRGLEVEYARVCWIPHRSPPPCPAGSFEGAGACLVPVKSAARPPTSLSP